MNKKIIGSMDAKSLYPSIETDRAVEIVVELVLSSNIKFEGPRI